MSIESIIFDATYRLNLALAIVICVQLSLLILVLLKKQSLQSFLMKSGGLCLIAIVFVVFTDSAYIATIELLNGISPMLKLLAIDDALNFMYASILVSILVLFNVLVYNKKIEEFLFKNVHYVVNNKKTIGSIELFIIGWGGIFLFYSVFLTKLSIIITMILLFLQYQATSYYRSKFDYHITRSVELITDLHLPEQKKEIHELEKHIYKIILEIDRHLPKFYKIDSIKIDAYRDYSNKIILKHYLPLYVLNCKNNQRQILKNDLLHLQNLYFKDESVDYNSIRINISYYLQYIERFVNDNKVQIKNISRPNTIMTHIFGTDQIRYILVIALLYLVTKSIIIVLQSIIGTFINSV